MVTRHPQRAEGPVCVIEYAIGREPYPKIMYCCGQFSPHCTFNSYGKSNEPWEPSKQVKQLPRLVMLGLQWSWVSLAFKVNIQCIVAYQSIFNANKLIPLTINWIAILLVFDQFMVHLDLEFELFCSLDYSMQMHSINCFWNLIALLVIAHRLSTSEIFQTLTLREIPKMARKGGLWLHH